MLDLNAREAMHLTELRSAREGHAGYRAVAQAMHLAIAERHPSVAAAMKHVDHSSEPRLERILAEIRGERRGGALAWRSGRGGRSRGGAPGGRAGRRPEQQEARADAGAVRAVDQDLVGEARHERYAEARAGAVQAAGACRARRR